MTPYRQPILPGDTGKDVLAVGRALVKRGHKLKPSLVADTAFVQALDAVLANHGLTPDGIYGPKAHAIIAPSFDRYGVWLYAHAALRLPYVNPFAAAADLVPGRTDMGVDFHGVGVIRALGDGTVIGLGGNGWPGGQYLLYRLSGGPHGGRYVYVAEAITPTVSTGHRLKAGEVLARFRPDSAPGTYPGIETGWASSTLNLTYAAVTTGYHEAIPTEAGKAFARLLRRLGCPTQADPGPGPTFPAAV